MEALKNKVSDYIKKHEHTTFTELENLFSELDHDYRGNTSFVNATYPNILYWTNWNQDTINVITDLLETDVIYMVQCSEALYLIDGKALKFPTPKDNIHSDKEYWLPIAFVMNS